MFLTVITRLPKLWSCHQSNQTDSLAIIRPSMLRFTSRIGLSLHIPLNSQEPLRHRSWSFWWPPKNSRLIKQAHPTQYESLKPGSMEKYQVNEWLKKLGNQSCTNLIKLCKDSHTLRWRSKREHWSVGLRQTREKRYRINKKIMQISKLVKKSQCLYQRLKIKISSIKTSQEAGWYTY